MHNWVNDETENSTEKVKLCTLNWDFPGPGSQGYKYFPGYHNGKFFSRETRELLGFFF